MMGEKINATGLTGSVSEERTMSQWGQWRREKSVHMLKCQVHKCMRETGRIFVMKLMSGSISGGGGSMEWLVVSPCRWQGLLALAQKGRWSVVWWWCTRVWMRWQGHTENHMQAWIHKKMSHMLFKAYTCIHKVLQKVTIVCCWFVTKITEKILNIFPHDLDGGWA